jgi:hypothetical protein
LYRFDTMKLLYSFILTSALAFTVFISKGQSVALGQWKDYLSYRQGISVTQGNGKVYCVAGSAVFSYNTQDNSIERYSKVNGLSDVSPTVARFCNATGTLVIGYPDGNIDLLQNGRIINIPDLKNASVQGSKIINNIYFRSDTAYISCGQGIMQVNLIQDIIMNTYYIGPGGSALNVYNISVCNDTLFAATTNGIYKISYTDANPSDYTRWKQVSKPIASGTGIAFNNIITVGDSLLTSYSNFLSKGVHDRDTLYTYYKGKWTYYKYVKGNDEVRAMQTVTVNDTNYLVLNIHYNVQIINPVGTIIKNMSGYVFGVTSPVDALADANLNTWVADAAYGLVETNSQWWSGQAYDPPGPFSNDVTSIALSSNTIWITPGGYGGAFNPLYIHNIGVSTFQNNTWSRILETPADNLYDINCVVVDPNNPYHAFAGSWNDGLIEYNNTSITKVYDSSNSSLSMVDGFPPLIRVGGLAYDTLGNLWVSTSLAASKYLSVKKTDGTWKAFDFGSLLPQATQVTQLLVTQTGAKWLLLPGTGILAYQDNGTFAAPNSSNTTLITTTAHHGAIPSQNIYCMAEDKNGAIWVGTDQSVVVFYSPDNVYDGNGDWDAQPVYVNQNGYTQYLMQNQVTTAIAIDGANRKWIGTQSGGVFLMSADGTQQISNFTSSNSPLLSNNIACISINPTTGEVFFGTDKGTVSYRGTATEGNLQFTNVYAFPNPVPHGYTGPVAITGLVTNSDIKITDISGELVYHTTSLGGQAIWYGTNFDGKRVQTGVYLVFCASPDGSQTHIAKLMFFN